LRRPKLSAIKESSAPGRRRRIFQKKVLEKIRRHILHSITFFLENRAVDEIMW
jgi:hypothetical protein